MSEPHDLDARALKARLEREERSVARLGQMLMDVCERNRKLEAVAEMARDVAREARDSLMDVPTRRRIKWLAGSLAALDAKDLSDAAAPEQLTNEAGELSGT